MLICAHFTYGCHPNHNQQNGGYILEKTEKKDVMQQYVTDKYFTKGHWWTKIWQTLVAIIGWICVAVPVYWTISSTLLANNPRFIHALFTLGSTRKARLYFTFLTVFSFSHLF